MSRGRGGGRRSTGSGRGRARTVARNSKGRFTTRAKACRSPRTTTTRERVGGSTRNRRVVYRDLGTGRFVSATFAASHARSTMAHRV